MWERSNLVQDAWFVALDRGEYVGMTEFLSNQADPDLFDIGVTGVLRSHRRREIATALKLRGIEFAQKRGIRELRTWNASNNEGDFGGEQAAGLCAQAGAYCVCEGDAGGAGGGWCVGAGGVSWRRGWAWCHPAGRLTKCIIWDKVSYVNYQPLPPLVNGLT